MKKDELKDEIRPEYDLTKLGKSVRGRYVDQYREGTNIVMLEPEVAQAFPDSAAVNAALRLLIGLPKDQLGGTRK